MSRAHWAPSQLDKFAAQSGGFRDSKGGLVHCAGATYDRDSTGIYIKRGKLLYITGAVRIALPVCRAKPQGRC